MSEHKVAFEDAVEIFTKPTLDDLDTSEDYGEERTNSLGETNGQVILVVTHTERNGKIRLISARKATTPERVLYDEYIFSLTLDPTSLDDPETPSGLKP